MIRFRSGSVSQTGRATLGVRLIRVDDDTKVASMAKVEPDGDDDDDQAVGTDGTTPDTGGSESPAADSQGEDTQDVDELVRRAEADSDDDAINGNGDDNVRGE